MRAVSGTIEDGAGSATLQAVKGEGTVDLTLSGGTPSAATVALGDVTDSFKLAATDVGGYFREQVEGVTRGWVVSDTLELKGVQTADESTSRKKATTTAVSSPPLTAEEQQLVGVTENPSAPPETRAFFKSRRCNALKNQYFGAVDDYLAPSGTVDDANAANLALAKGRVLGCTGWTTGPGANFIAV